MEDMSELRESLSAILGERELERVLSLNHGEFQAYLARLVREDQQLRAFLGEEEYQRRVATIMVNMASGRVQ